MTNDFCTAHEGKKTGFLQQQTHDVLSILVVAISK